MKNLIQKHFGSKIEFLIKEDELFVKKNNFNTSIEYAIKYETLGFDIVRKKTKGIILLIPFFLSATGLQLYVLNDEYKKGTRFPQLLIYIGATAFFVLLTIMSFFQNKDEVILAGGSKKLKITGNKPDSQKVEYFINSLHKAMRRHYNKNYGIVDIALTDEENIQKFKWLKNIKAINDAEYEKLIYELKLKGLLS